MLETTLRTILRLGTVSNLGRLGTLANSFKHIKTVSVRDRVRLGAGSSWIGSWQHIGSYESKTFGFNVGNTGTSGGGSIGIVAGLTGTGVAGMTGTYLSPTRIGKGTVTFQVVTGAFRYVRPWVRQHGLGPVPQHGGTVSVHLGLRS